MKRALTLMIGTTALMFATAASANEPVPAPDLEPDPAYTSFRMPRAGETSFEFKLKGYVFGLKMITANYKGHIGDVNYTAYADLNTSGLGAILKKLRIWAVTKGQYNAGGLYPLTHIQQNRNKKNRRVEMDYDYDTREVAVDIHPPLGSQGVPPASMEERFEADDTITTILAMMMRGTRIDGELCKGTIPVFDSKQHYGLRMVRLGPKKVKYNGKKVMGVKCHFFYEPISGFDPEDLPEEEESSTPINVYFAKDETANLYVPVEFAYKISGFKAKIKLSDMRIAMGADVSGNVAETVDAEQTD